MSALSPTQLRWLRYLAEHPGETPWDRMPQRQSRQSHGHSRPLGAVTSSTWKLLSDAGLITARYGQRHWSEPTGWLFSITDAGRAALAAQEADHAAR